MQSISNCFRWTGQRCPWLGCLHRQRPRRCYPRTKNCVALFRCITTASSSTSLCYQRLLPLSRGLARPLQARNFVFVGLPAYLQRRLQAVLNAAARLVFRLRRYDQWPRHRCPRDTALAAFAGMGQLQACAHGIPSTERYGAIVPESTRSGIKPASIFRSSGTLCLMTCNLHHLFLPFGSS